MKNGRAKRFIIMIATAALMAATFAMTAFAGTWKQDSTGWRYTQDNGTEAVGSWIEDSGRWYRMGSNGYMKTGWYQDMEDNGHWYYLNTASTGTEGAMKTGWLQDTDGKWYLLDNRAGGPEGHMLTGWQWVDGYCYYLDPANGGAMTSSGVTPDGYTVDADGRWTENGVPKYDAGKGLSTKSTSVTGISGGISGGGSSGGSSSGSSSSSSSATNTLSKNGYYNSLSKTQKAEVDEAIEDFMDEYIDDDMSDFEIEMTIIQWIVENCEYELNNPTCYDCIINGVAQCSGYADAFLQMAKACGLDARYVYSDNHAWNLVKLDGKWYHVDCTWEDPTGSTNNYGFGNLRNKYINLEDDEIKQYRDHTSWAPNTTKCTGIAYGPDVVAHYMATGEVDTSLGKSYKDRQAEFFDPIESDKDTLTVTYSSLSSTKKKIVSYLEERIDARESNFKILLYMPSSYKQSRTGDYSKVTSLADELADAVCDEINEKYYGDVLKNKISIFFYIETYGSGNYYSYKTYNLYYTNESMSVIPVDYTIHYVDADGNEVAVQNGEQGMYTDVELEIPDGYEINGTASSSKNYKANKGTVTYNKGTSITLKSSGTVDVTVYVKSVVVEEVPGDDEENDVEEDIEEEETGKDDDDKNEPVEETSSETSEITTTSLRYEPESETETADETDDEDAEEKNEKEG